MEAAVETMGALKYIENPLQGKADDGVAGLLRLTPWG